MWDLIFLTKNRTFCTGRQSLNPWTISEVLRLVSCIPTSLWLLWSKSQASYSAVSDTSFASRRGQRCWGGGRACGRGGKTRQRRVNWWWEDPLQPHHILQRTVPAFLSLGEGPEEDQTVFTASSLLSSFIPMVKGICLKNTDKHTWKFC